MEAFHTLRIRHNKKFPLEDFELFTLTISALKWREYNGSIKLVTDSIGAKYICECGLIDAWSSIEILLDDLKQFNINEDVFWAGSKLYALSKQKIPCVMIDLDFILWRAIDFSQYGKDLAVIHREDIYPTVYPPKEFFNFIDGWQLPNWLNWSIRPCNGALVYFGSKKFLREYTTFALEFMQKANEKDDRLCYMVFAEQRWMAMCAEHFAIPIHEFSSLAELFDNKQKYFTHVWGYKQKLRDNPIDAENFCRQCADRLKQDFPDFTAKLKNYSWAAKYIND